MDFLEFWLHVARIIGGFPYRKIKDNRGPGKSGINSEDGIEEIGNRMKYFQDKKLTIWSNILVVLDFIIIISISISFFESRDTYVFVTTTHEVSRNVSIFSYMICLIILTVHSVCNKRKLHYLVMQLESIAVKDHDKYLWIDKLGKFVVSVYFIFSILIVILDFETDYEILIKQNKTYSYAIIKLFVMAGSNLMFTIVISTNVFLLHTITRNFSTSFRKLIELYTPMNSSKISITSNNLDKNIKIEMMFKFHKHLLKLIEYQDLLNNYFAIPVIMIMSYCIMNMIHTIFIVTTLSLNINEYLFFWTMIPASIFPVAQLCFIPSFIITQVNLG